MSPENYNLGEKVLIALSYKRHVNWMTFKRICDSMIGCDPVQFAASKLQQSNKTPFILLRLLDGLGHCDSSFCGKHQTITIAPPVMARLPLAGPPQAVIIGRRSDSLVDEALNVADQFNGTIIEQHACNSAPEFSPQRILVQSGSPEEISEFADKLGIYYSNSPPAWSILHFAGNIKEYRNCLIWTKTEILDWPCCILDQESGRFRRGVDDGKAILVSYTNPVTNTRIHFYRKDAQQAEVNRDWGRYLLFQDKSKSVLQYDERKCIVGVPILFPLPRLYARVLALCSGIAPVRKPLTKGGLDWQFYRYVPKQIADLLARKLDQSLKPFRFENDNHGEY